MTRLKMIATSLQYSAGFHACFMPGIGRVPEAMVLTAPPEYQQMIRDAGENFGKIGVGTSDLKTRKAWDRVLKGPTPENAPDAPTYDLSRYKTDPADL